ncbi:MAG: sigma-70 family RNA polymerase sigma factor, partial [Patescibacteria group bacterium]
IVALLESEGIHLMESSEEYHEPEDGTDQSIKERDTVGLYLKEAVKVPLLSGEEEVDLCKRIKRGENASNLLIEESGVRPVPAKRKAVLQAIVQDGVAAREHLILANSRLVVSIAKKYRQRGVAFADLIQEGNIGLIRSALKFEYQRGNRFSTYATWWIKQAVTRVIADHSRTIRVPVHAHETIVKMSKVTQRLNQELGRYPTTEEIAQALRLTKKEVENMIKAGNKTISLEEPTNYDDDASVLGDFIEDKGAQDPPAEVAQNLLAEQLEEILGWDIPVREKRVLELRFGLEDGFFYTLESTGQKMGITRERVRQIEAQALRRLRSPKYKQLREYLRE